MNEGKEVSTTEYSIRRMEESDLPAVRELLADARVMRFLEPPYSPEQAGSFLRKAGLSEPPLIYAAEDRSGRFLGYVIYHPFDARSMEIGWVLRPSAWGKGVASELTRMLIARAAQEGKAAVIECSPEQAATRRIAAKFGFSPVGEEGGLLIYRLHATQRPPSGAFPRGDGEYLRPSRNTHREEEG